MEEKDFDFDKLDKTKIDWRTFVHTNSSMLVKGVYPLGVAESDVLQHVNGSTGGYFRSFENGRFVFIACTD